MQMSPEQLAVVRAAPELVKDGRLSESRLCLGLDWGVFQGWFLDLAGLQFLIQYTVRESQSSNSVGKGEPPLETPSQIKKILD